MEYLTRLPHLKMMAIPTLAVTVLCGLPGCSARIAANQRSMWLQQTPGFTPHIAFAERGFIVTETWPGAFFVVGSSNANLALAEARLGCGGKWNCLTAAAGDVWDVQEHPGDSPLAPGPWPKLIYNEPSFLVAETAPGFFRVLATDAEAFKAAARQLNCGSAGICSEARQGPAWTIQRIRRK